MAKVNKSDAVWVEIDPSSLATAQQQAYEGYKALYREMKAKREAFEQAMQEGVPEGQRMVFGYNFGKLSVAIVADERKAAKPKQGSLTLAQFIAQQAASGSRV